MTSDDRDAWVPGALRDAVAWGEGEIERWRVALLEHCEELRRLFLDAEGWLGDGLDDRPDMRRVMHARFDDVLRAHHRLVDDIAGWHAGGAMDRVRAVATDLEVG